LAEQGSFHAAMVSRLSVTVEKSEISGQCSNKVIRAIDAASEKVYFLSVGFLFSGGVSQPRAESLARLEALLKANNGSRLNRACKSPHQDPQRSRKT
jgi:hypothetical protein